LPVREGFQDASRDVLTDKLQAVVTRIRSGSPWQIALALERLESARSDQSPAGATPRWGRGMVGFPIVDEVFSDGSAAAHALSIPRSTLLRADEVIR